MSTLIFALIVSFVLSVVVTPLVIKLARRLKMGQTVLHYVDNHSGKSGTPTMGGLGFVSVGALTTLIFTRGQGSLTVMLIFLTLGFALIGFLDDFIKVYFKQNKGLSPLQKIVFQVAVSVIIAFFVYRNQAVGDRIYLPFTMKKISLGFWAVPIYAFVFIAFTNAVNLTDGLDGLAGKTSVVYLLFFSATIAIITYKFGLSALESKENEKLLVFCACMIGAICGFLLFNTFPASIFMGDTGALALGGALAGLAVMSGLSLLAPIIGIVYVFTCLSDIIQVLHYKRTKRRIFLMAPFHHHLERKGIHENKIVTIYTLVTALFGCVSVALLLVFA